MQEQESKNALSFVEDSFVMHGIVAFEAHKVG